MEAYLSVSEFAKLHGKDAGNIRRLLSSGRLNGQKAGNQWIIPAGTPYPADRRVTTGEYRRWRNRIALNRDKDLMKTISDMIISLRSVYGKMMTEAVLYGSYARGTQTEESDIDIAVFLTGKPSGKMTDAMIECVSSYELVCGKVLSVIDIDSAKFDQWKDVLPFYKNIRREGIVLWKAAE